MDFASQMEEERQRLNKKLEELGERRAALDQEENAVHIELTGIQAYLDAKMGKVVTRQKTGKVSKPRGPRKTGIREQVLSTITAEGIDKKDIISKMGATEDKTLQQAISNSLVALKKDNKIVSGERGQYKLAEAKQIDKTPKRVPKETAPAAQ